VVNEHDERRIEQATLQLVRNAGAAWLAAAAVEPAAQIVQANVELSPQAFLVSLGLNLAQLLEDTNGDRQRALDRWNDLCNRAAAAEEP
jgi:hypothetical protein